MAKKSTRRTVTRSLTRKIAKTKKGHEEQAKGVVALGHGIGITAAGLFPGAGAPVGAAIAGGSILAGYSQAKFAEKNAKAQLEQLRYRARVAKMQERARSAREAYARAVKDPSTQKSLGVVEVAAHRATRGGKSFWVKAHKRVMAIYGKARGK